MHHLAIDIGASSGRIVYGTLQNNKLVIQEIHRFPNHFSIKEERACWDMDYLVNEILLGLQQAKLQGITKCTIGIDTWAVDYVLLDEFDKPLQPAFAYRDGRTAHTMPKVFAQIPKEIIYEKTGIQFMSFNTIFQLYEEREDILREAKTILLIPDYLNFILTGDKTAEITNASTTQLLNVHTREYDKDLLQFLGLTRQQFPLLIEPGTVIGPLQNEAFLKFDLPEAQIIAVASHDTASAVLGTPATAKNWAFLSSGTWSLVGVENNSPILSKKSLNENYTNEFGAFQTFRFLKNIMGLWIIQEVRRLLPREYTFDELVEHARAVPPCQQFINFNEDRFLNPNNMIEEIQLYCKVTNQAIPISVGEIASAVYHNIAILTAFHLDHIEEIINRPIHHLHIVGGGAHNNYLNECIATYSQRTVYAGPTEATAIGNLLIQLIADQKIDCIDTARRLVYDSFEIQQFSPINFNKEELFNKFLSTIS